MPPSCKTDETVPSGEPGLAARWIDHAKDDDSSFLAFTFRHPKILKGEGVNQRLGAKIPRGVAPPDYSIETKGYLDAESAALLIDLSLCVPPEPGSLATMNRLNHLRHRKRYNELATIASLNKL